jgi:predicted RNA-binding protein with PIN domain
MKHYIIDGNNLIGKDRLLTQLQKKDKQQSREKAAFIISRYFGGKKATISLHFDGFKKEIIKALNIKIIYSSNHPADLHIKREIEKSKNPRNIVLVTSDSNLMEFGRVCSCQLIKSEEFVRLIRQSSIIEEEQFKINPNAYIEEFKIIFEIDKPKL